MWICLTNAFLSIVENFNDPDTLLVRARLPQDIQRVFTDADVWENTKSDYRYRAILPRQVVADTIAAHLKDIHYTNFKNAVDEAKRHDAYLSCWAELRELQPDGSEPTLPPKR